MATLSYIKDRRKWRVRWRATNRKTHKIFSGSKIFIDKPQAIKFYGDMEAQERLFRQGRPVRSESVANAVGEFMRHMMRHTERTRQHYRMVLKKFSQNLTVSTVDHIAAHHIREYLYVLHDRGCKNRTLNSQLTAIKSFCRFVSERYNVPNPAAQVKMLKEDPPQARVLKDDEYAKVLEAATPLARARLIFIANTGVRATEFSSLQLDGDTVTVLGKGRKRRTVPLNKTARAALLQLRPGTRNALWLSFSRLARKVGIPKFGSHALRHRFATELLKKGVPLIIVSRLLGHASTRTTERCYAHILPDDLANATKVLDK